MITCAKCVQKYRISTVHWNFEDKDFQFICHSGYNFIVTHYFYQWMLECISKNLHTLIEQFVQSSICLMLNY